MEAAQPLRRLDGATFKYPPANARQGGRQGIDVIKMFAPWKGANPLGHPTVGSSALRASSPTATHRHLCLATDVAISRLHRFHTAQP